MDYSLEERRRQLYRQIQEWNQNRLDLFAISEPNQVSGVCALMYRPLRARVCIAYTYCKHARTGVELLCNPPSKCIFYRVNEYLDLELGQRVDEI